ncbi:class I SAM-dependent methyltransferase [Paraburkholderia fungorum]|uniref:class I SAM-dependent methyltransferase n=1 Tax=Paraburkholderia fungorum TaxID=134537 RepID=UPI00402B7A2B
MKLDAFRRMGSIECSLGRVLEIGCGNCTFVKIAREIGVAFESFVGIDRSESAIRHARINVADIPDSRLITGDARILPLPSKSVDTIIALGVLEHIEDLDSCLEELARVSAPGCRLIVSTSNTRSMMYLMRLCRQAIGAWRYGFQRNDSDESLSVRLRPQFEVTTTAWLHGDRDFIFSTLLDKLIGLFIPRWGRYVLIEAKLKKTKEN